jgi:hypothetical protein
MKEVDYVYSDSGCYLGYTIIKDRPFKGYECEGWRKIGDGKDGNVKKLFRYSRGDNWSSSVCQNECIKRDYYANWEETCQSMCFRELEITQPSFKYGSKYETEVISDELEITRQSKTNEENEDMAVLKNYRYYMYGNGWAKILGMASGTAPSLTCKRKHDIYRYDFLKPIGR